ncbi:MAG: hypothetical protein M3072_17740, partial [Candidatus Dormibacteraeota bacterium]|nr:hypothetical protein [Candidatus Dormibacteraeota bacterium]
MASSYTWAELHVTPKNPSAHWTSDLARRVAQELAERGWKLEAAMTDNASEYRAQEFNHTLVQLGIKHILEFPRLGGHLMIWGSSPERRCRDATWGIPSSLSVRVQGG